MSFFSHLGELRRRITWVIVLWAGGAVTLYYWGWDVFAFMIEPVVEAVPGLPVVGTSPFELFTARFIMAFFTSVVVTAPITIYHFMAFFLPALKKGERKWFLPIFFSMVFFFALGVTFCYLFVLGPGFGWLLSQGGGVVDPLMKVTELMRGVMLFLLGFGIGFQTPVVVFGLIVMGIVPYKKMRQNWRVAYVIIMVVASVATPDWSWVTMLSLFGAMLVLYEGSLLAARFALRKRIAAQKALE